MSVPDNVAMTRRTVLVVLIAKRLRFSCIFTESTEQKDVRLKQGDSEDAGENFGQIDGVVGDYMRVLTLLQRRDLRELLHRWDQDPW